MDFSYGSCFFSDSRNINYCTISNEILHAFIYGDTKHFCFKSKKGSYEAFFEMYVKINAEFLNVLYFNHFFIKLFFFIGNFYYTFHDASKEVKSTNVMTYIIFECRKIQK